MKAFSLSFRTLVFSLVFTVIVSGILSTPAFITQVDKKLKLANKTSLCEDCYIVYVWIEGVRWAEVFNQDGKMVNFYSDPEE